MSHWLTDGPLFRLWGLMFLVVLGRFWWSRISMTAESWQKWADTGMLVLMFGWMFVFQAEDSGGTRQSAIAAVAVALCKGFEAVLGRWGAAWVVSGLALACFAVSLREWLKRRTVTASLRSKVLGGIIALLAIGATFNGAYIHAHSAWCERCRGLFVVDRETLPATAGLPQRIKWARGALYADGRVQCPYCLHDFVLARK